MDQLSTTSNLFFHIGSQLALLVDFFGPYIYLVLFLIILAETGLVVAPFLPGDSLLFAAGAVAGFGYLDVSVLFVSLTIAAIIGDSLNYWIGSKMGPRVFARENSKVFKKEYLEKTRAFYEKHGGKTIVLARFLPFVRTFAPFVAGVGKMHYKTFLFYNVIGAVLWVGVFVFAGYFFGGLPFIQQNLHLAMLVLILLALLPILIEYGKHKISQRRLNRLTYSKLKKTIKEVNDEETK